MTPVLHALLMCYILNTRGVSASDMLPNIIPDVNQTVIYTGENIELLCSATEPIHWLYPQLYDETRELVVDDLPTVVYNYDGFKYTSHLFVQGANYLYTARYYCQRNDTTQPHPYSAANIYVYVKDKDNLIACYDPNPWLIVKQYGDVLIPCRPSSPDVKMELYRGEKLVDRSSLKEESMEIEYDPTEGFTLRHLDMNNGAYYECVAELGDKVSKRSVYIKVLRYTSSAPKPWMSDTEGMHVEVGDNFTLECWVDIASDINHVLKWIYPNINEVSRITEKNVQIRGGRTLTISKATHDDEGDYTCKIQDHNQHTNNISHYLKIYDINTTYNNLVHNGRKSMTVFDGEEVKWVVKIIAHPKPNITWYDQLKNEVHNSSRRVVFVNKKQTYLKINNVDILDTGNYSLKSENDNGTTWKNFSLVVLDIPRVGIMDVNSYFNQGQRYKIRCDVLGYPTPRIRWFIRYCRIPNECGQVDSYEVMNNHTQISYTNIEYDKTFWESTLNILAQDSGQLICLASNEIGASNYSINFKVTDIGNEDQFNVWGPETPIEGDEVRLHCGGVVSNFSGDISWFRTDNNLTTQQNITNNTDFTILNTSTNLSYQSTIFIPSINNKYNGVYGCTAEKINGDPEIMAITIDVQDLQAPYFKDTNMNQTKWYMDSRTTLHWRCNVGGTPKPDVTWYKDDTLFSKDTIAEGSNESRIEWRDDNQTLVLKFLDETDDGTYKCLAKNKVAILEKTVTLTVKGGRLGGGVIAGISVLVIVCLGAVIYMSWKIHEERRILREMAVVGLIHFEEGAMDNMNPELPLDEQAELLPYDKKWEFPRDKLKLGKQLGAGAFGVVMKAEAWGIVEGETVRAVAVKMVKKNADYTYLKALASELKIMVHLGKHLNVVNLLGACTKNLAKKELLVIVEFCRYGNLQNYLIRHRDHFIDQIDKKTGQIDSSIGSDVLARATSLSVKTNGEINSSEDYRTSPGYLAPCSPGLTPNSPGIDSDMTFTSMTPTVEDNIIHSNNSSQPEWRSNVHGDYKLSNVRPICTRDLLCWAFQVARGMEYLAGRKVLHGDLAARNILLADDNIVKICDFGLAKSMYKSDNYKKKGDGPLPLKWMAVESIRDRIFSTQSDVWSFGIVLWEFFSLARTPYPGMEVNEKLYNKLVAGYRMECTDYATKEIYKVMLECWQAHPTQRPSFTDLSETLGAMLEESVRNHYIELNDHYTDMNMIQLEGHSDYLSMMSAPTYGNLVSPSYEGHEQHYAINPSKANNTAQESGGGSGYLCMKTPHPPGSDNVSFNTRTGYVSGNIFQFDTPPGRKKIRNVEMQGTAAELRPMITNAEEPDSKSPSQINNLNNLNQDTRMRNDPEPMKEMKITNDLKLGQTCSGQTPSFSNPNYQSTINPSPDNYVNMPQHKLEENSNKDKFKGSHLRLLSTNQKDSTMGKPKDLKIDSSAISSEAVNSFYNNGYQSKVVQESGIYVNLPN